MKTKTSLLLFSVSIGLSSGIDQEAEILDRMNALPIRQAEFVQSFRQPGGVTMGQFAGQPISGPPRPTGGPRPPPPQPPTDLLKHTGKKGAKLYTTQQQSVEVPQQQPTDLLSAIQGFKKGSLKSGSEPRKHKEVPQQPAHIDSTLAAALKGRYGAIHGTHDKDDDDDDSWTESESD